jgi:hypothetical protein
MHYTIFLLFPQTELASTFLNESVGKNIAISQSADGINNNGD